MNQFEAAVYSACKAFIDTIDRIDIAQASNTALKPNQPQKAQRKEAVEWTDNGPICTVHDTNLKLRHGQYGDFYSCGVKDAQGNYCKSHAKAK